MPCAVSSRKCAGQPWACPGHPRLTAWPKAWMPGIKPGMTVERPCKPDRKCPKSGAFDDAHVALDVAGAERFERLLVSWRIVRGDRLRHAVEFHHHHALVQSGLVDLRRIVADDVAAAGVLQRRTGELRIGLPSLRILHRPVSHHPIRLRPVTHSL